MNKLVYAVASALLMFGLVACQSKITDEEAKKNCVGRCKSKGNRSNIYK